MRSFIFCSIVAGLCAGSATLAAAASRPGSHANRPARLAKVTKVRKAPLQENGTGLTGSYFSNGTLAGAPVMRRVDASIDFQWGLGAPSASLPPDNFSVRWEGLLAAPSTGRYRFVVRTDNEFRLWVNGRKILDTWDGRKTGAGEGSVELAAGEKTSIKLEYANSEGIARLQLQWVLPGQAPQLVPTSNLYPLDTPLIPDPAAPAVAAAPTTPAPVATPAAEPAATTPTPAPEAPKVAKAPKPVKITAKPAAPATATATPEVAKAEKPAKPEAKGVEGTAAGIPSGVYILTSRATGKPLEVVEFGRPNSRAYQTAAAGGPVVEGRSTAPQWRIENLGNGFYQLAVQGGNKVLEVLGSSTSNGTPMNLWTYYSGNNQLWRIEPTEHGNYKLLAKHSKKALTAKDSLNGGVQQWRYNGNLEQQWKLEPVAPEANVPMAAASNVPGVGANKMSLYPNPSNGVVQLAYVLKEETPVGWVVYNQRGAVVRVSDYRRRPVGSQHQTLNLATLPPGDYYLHLTVGTTTTKQPLLIRQPSAEAAPMQEAPASPTSAANGGK